MTMGGRLPFESQFNPKLLPLGINLKLRHRPEGAYLAVDPGFRRGFEKTALYGIEHGCTIMGQRVHSQDKAETESRTGGTTSHGCAPLPAFPISAFCFLHGGYHPAMQTPTARPRSFAQHPRVCWRVSADTSPLAEEAVAEWLGTVFGQPAVTYTDLERDRTRVDVFLTVKPAWTRARRNDLRAGLNAAAARAGDTTSPAVKLSRVRAQDWTESWKRHFQPIEVGQSLLVKPSWSRKLPRKGQAVVVLDPGLSFGTGQHPTTAFCLEQLARRRHPDEPQSFLDIGTGSGILAIAAAKLGYTPIQAFDNDPDAVRVATANARRNRVERRVAFQCQDLMKLASKAARRYSVLCANLTADLLLREQPRILAQLAEGGVLVLAGILKSQFAQVRDAYEASGLRLVASRAGKEWRSGAFTQAHRSR